MVSTIETRHLDYFKALLEGRAEMSFSAYRKANEESLRAQLPRAQFLRLKFGPVEEMERILQACGMDYHPHALSIRREQYLAQFHPDVLDDKGRLKQGHKDALFNGAVGCFARDEQAAKEALHACIGFPGALNCKKSLAMLEEVEGFAEIELGFGDARLGLFLLRILADIARQHSDADDAVLRARDALARHAQVARATGAS